MTRFDELADLLSRPPEEAAPHLLGSQLVSGVGDRLVRLRITEVEAYKGSDDPASHAYRGPTQRNKSMFMTPGTLYVYRSYGIHHCANVSTGPEGVGWAILIRGGEISEGEPVARERRLRNDQLANGPGKVCQALGIDSGHDGTNLLDPASVIRLEPGIKPELILSTQRVGISKAKEKPWRFVVADAVTTRR